MDDLKVSGEACVLALLRAGFRLKQRASGFVFLTRNGKIVMVPDVEVMEPDMLRAILRSADISEAELVRHLVNGPTRSGFFVKTVTPEVAAPKSTGGRRRR